MLRHRKPSSQCQQIKPTSLIPIPPSHVTPAPFPFSSSIPIIPLSRFISIPRTMSYQYSDLLDPATIATSISSQPTPSTARSTFTASLSSSSYQILFQGLPLDVSEKDLRVCSLTILHDRLLLPP